MTTDELSDALWAAVVRKEAVLADQQHGINGVINLYRDRVAAATTEVDAAWDALGEEVRRASIQSLGGAE